MSSGATQGSALGAGLNLRLSLMMFLQYAVWGAWLPLFFSFLVDTQGLSGEQAGGLFAIAAIGALVAPFLAGPICDRYFNIEKFLGLSHLVGAFLVWQIASCESYQSLVIYGLLYSLVYAPTLPLTNAVAFHHLPDRDRDFGKVRVWGTIGWIVVGIAMGQYLYQNFLWSDENFAVEAQRVAVERLVSHDNYRDGLKVEDIAASADAAVLLRALLLRVEDEPELVRAALEGEALLSREFLASQQAYHLGVGKADSLRLSAILGLILGLFCFLLPPTPPQRQQGSAVARALKEINRAPLLALFMISFPIACVHQFYFVRTDGFLQALEVRSPWIDRIFGIGGGPMTIGQIAEIAVLALMPFFVSRFSKKSLLMVGLIAYAARFGIFAFASDPWAVYPALALHGLCFGCFFFIAFMIIDEHTTSDVRASTQSLYNLIIVGIGTIVGNYAAGVVDTVATNEAGGTDYQVLFGIPCAVSVVCIVLLALFYPRRAPTAPDSLP